MVVSTSKHVHEEGERDLFPFKCPKKKISIFKIELVSFKDKVKNRWDWTTEETIEKCKPLREKAKNHFKAGEIEEAKEIYT